MKPKPPQDLWSQMDAIVAPPRQQMEGISGAEFAARHGISESAARKRLQDAETRGKLISGYRKHAAGWVKVYRPK